MERIQIKNYRSFKNVCLNLSKINFFIGENNVGKTSLMKLINSYCNSRDLIFKNTWLSLQNKENILFKNEKKLELFMNFNKENGELKQYENKIFEKSTIEFLEKFDLWAITELITSDLEGRIVKIKINYVRQGPEKNLLVESLQIDAVDGRDFFDYLQNENINFEYIEELDRIFADEIKPKDFSEKFVLKNSGELKQEMENFRFHKLKDGLAFTKRDLVICQIELNHSSNNLKVNAIYLMYLKLLELKYKSDSEDKKLNKLNSISPLDNGIRRLDNIKNFDYIKPLRNEFKKFYFEKDLSVEGNSHILKLKNDKVIRAKVNQFLKKFTDIKKIEIVEDKIPLVFEKVYIPTYVSKEREKTKFNLIDSGTGISQILPIVIKMLEYKNHEKGSLFIEQPEVHLHPKAQIEFGKSIHSLLASDGEESKFENENFIFETHSNFILDAIRYEIFKNSSKNSSPSHSLFKFFFFFRDNNEVKVDFFKINKDGKFSGNYYKYIEFLEQETFKMMEI